MNPFKVGDKVQLNVVEGRNNTRTLIINMFANNLRSDDILIVRRVHNNWVSIEGLKDGYDHRNFYLCQRDHFDEELFIL